MGRAFSTESNLVFKVWKLFLEEWEIDYSEESLYNLILWTKGKGEELTAEIALDTTYWSKKEEETIQEVLKNNPKAVKALKLWRKIINLIKQIKWEYRVKRKTWRKVTNLLIAAELRKRNLFDTKLFQKIIEQ